MQIIYCIASVSLTWEQDYAFMPILLLILNLYLFYATLSTFFLFTVLNHNENGMEIKTSINTHGSVISMYYLS